MQDEGQKMLKKNCISLFVFTESEYFRGLSNLNPTSEI